MPRFMLFLSLFSLVFLVACGGGSSPTQNFTPPPVIAVQITPTSATSLVNQSTQFTATVTGTSNTLVNWSVFSKDYVPPSPQWGTIDRNGLYTASWTVGTYKVVAQSVADPSKTAVATVEVSAQFGFIQQLASGKSVPFATTPLVATLAKDGSFSAASVNDPTTGKPVDAGMEDVFLSADGKKTVASLMQGYCDGISAVCNFAYNIVIANTDGSASAQLTQNEPGSSMGDFYPQFSPDGKQIVYGHSDWSNSSDAVPGIYIMNADGTNPHVILAYQNTNAELPLSAITPSFSPDGKQIVMEAIQRADQGNGSYAWYDGIATMNADGSNFKQLTIGSPDPTCQGWDELPTFTNDGKQIAYSKQCWPGNGDYPTETIWVMNADGTGAKQIQGSGAMNVISCDPLAVADGLVFSTNQDHPGTNQFELYSMRTDGTNPTRLTNNTVYDAFSIWWMNYSVNSSAAAARIPGSIANRLAHRKLLRELRGEH